MRTRGHLHLQLSVHQANPPVSRLFRRFTRQGLEATARGRFDGGDSHWERKNLKNYGESELRLTEIQEKICEDVHDGKHRVGVGCSQP